jgi:hypothetical protein
MLRLALQHADYKRFAQSGDSRKSSMSPKVTHHSVLAAGLLVALVGCIDHSDVRSGLVTSAEAAGVPMLEPVKMLESDPFHMSKMQAPIKELPPQF